MYLLGRGLRAIGLNAPCPGQAIHSARHIHIQTRPRPPGVFNSQSATQTARHFVGRFFAHLTTPGLGSELNNGVRSMHLGSASRNIQQGLSFPARQALGRPLGAPHLPRPPKLPGNVANVGLGVARNFSTARPFFQNLVENVPIAGRAFWEVEWDQRMLKEKTQMKAIKKAKKASNQSTKVSHQSSKENQLLSRPTEAETQSEKEELDFERYFPTGVVAPVTTYLSIPLAPTPTSRLPLEPAPPTTQAPLLPLMALGATHALHERHATRVSSLFSRLDAANVWARGASCTAHGDRTGLCTVLLVAFEGWDEFMVRGVIGEGGKGWCELYEVRKNDSRSESPSDMSVSTHEGSVDPAVSLILPSTNLCATEYPFGLPRSIVSTPFSSSSASAFSSPPGSPRLSPSHTPDFDDTFSLSDSFSSSGSSDVDLVAQSPAFEFRVPEALMSEAEDEMSEWGSESDMSLSSEPLYIDSLRPSSRSSSLGFSSAVESQWSAIWHA